MSDFLTMSCPSCGGKLQINKDIKRFNCLHCGNEHITQMGDGIVYIQPVIERIGKIQTGVDKTASELAIRRLQEEISSLKTSLNSLHGEKSDNDRKIGCGFIIVIIGFVMLINLNINIAYLVFGLPLIAIGIKILIDGLKYSNNKNELEFDLREKQLEIEKHKKIVDL